MNHGENPLTSERTPPKGDVIVSDDDVSGFQIFVMISGGEGVQKFKEGDGIDSGIGSLEYVDGIVFDGEISFQCMRDVRKAEGSLKGFESVVHNRN